MLTEVEDKTALGLVIAGYIGLVIHGFMTMGAEQGLLIFIIYAIFTLLSVVAGTLAAFVTAAMMQTSFGVFQSAVLRLAGIMVSTTAISVIMPFGGLLSLILFFVLLSWFFELEGMEIIVFTVVLWVMRYLVLLALAIIIGTFLAAIG